MIEVPVTTLPEGTDAADYVAETYGVKEDLDKLNKDVDDLDELYIFDWGSDDKEVVEDGETKKDHGLVAKDYVLVNKSGKIVDDDTRCTDGEDYVYVTDGSGRIVAIYLEN